MRIYINGEEDPITGDTPEMPVYENNLVIGEIDTWAFKGKVDEVAILSKALTGDEVTQLMGGVDEFLLAVQPMGMFAVTWGGVKNSY